MAPFQVYLSQSVFPLETANTSNTANTTNTANTANTANTSVQEIWPIQQRWPYDSLDCLLLNSGQLLALFVTYMYEVQYLSKKKVHPQRIERTNAYAYLSTVYTISVTYYCSQLLRYKTFNSCGGTKYYKPLYNKHIAHFKASSTMFSDS